MPVTAWQLQLEGGRFHGLSGPKVRRLRVRLDQRLTLSSRSDLRLELEEREGREGRLATNPIAYAFPTQGDPILADFSTSVTPEGKIRVYRNRGENLPEGWVQDAQGRPTIDPEQFYGPPRGGILPLGGVASHKGYALGLFVELLGSSLAGLACDDPGTGGNGVCFVVIDPSRFVDLDTYRKLVSETREYMKSAEPAPGVEEVLVPGELEFRARQQRESIGVPVDPVAWQQIVEHAARLGVSVP